MKKNLLVASFFCLLSFASFADDTDFTIDENGVLTAYTGYGGDVVIPGTVTEIAEKVGMSNNAITSVVIPGSVKKIGELAFSHCSKLTKVTFNEGLEELGGHAFRNTKITSVSLPSTVKSTGLYAFCYCSQLTSVILGKSFESYGDYTFHECPSLSSIIVLSGNNHFIVSSNVLYNINKDKLIRYAPKKTGTTFTVPSTVVSIGRGAFHQCTNITTITIPRKVNYIGMSCFNECTALEKITVGWASPDDVSTQEGDAMFFRVPRADVTLRVPEGAENLYKNSATWKDFNITGYYVTLESQTITFGELAGVMVGDDDFDPGATASSGLKVSYTSSNTDVATIIDNGYIKIINGGTTVITASQPGNVLYKAATPVSQTLTVTGGISGLDIDAAVSVRLYPNPTVDILYIDSPVAVQKATLYALNGAVAIQENNVGSKINVSTLPKGIYMLKLTTGQGEVIRKIVKE